MALRKGHRVKAFENRMLWRIFGPKRDGVTGDWRKLHNEELHNLYSLPNVNYKIKEDQMGRACSTNGRGIHIRYCWERQKERDHWEDQDVGGRTILK
jgi:hypothetical protein